MMAPPPILASRERGRGRLPETIRARATLNPKLDPASGILTAHMIIRRTTLEYTYAVDQMYIYILLPRACVRHHHSVGY